MDLPVHANSHEAGGLDEVQITAAQLPVHASSHGVGGSDPVTATPTVHATAHESGGSDPVNPLAFNNTLCALTPEGGFAVRLTNNTGAPSVKGTIVRVHGASAFQLSEVDDFNSFGVVYEAGIANGAACLVVVGGRCQVKLEDGVGSSLGNWVRTSTSAVGRADATAAAPPGLLLQHFAEIGHCLETVAGDASGALCYAMIHFN